jgi:hypothetical protein
MTPRTSTPTPRPSLLARFGPLTAVLVAIGLVAVLASTGRDDTGSVTAATSQAGSANADLPITWAEAKKAGTTAKYDWGPNCDTKLGRVKVPSVYAPPCEVARPGVEGGATYQGVTATTITVVAYELADDDLSASLSAQLDSVPAARDTRENLLAMFESRFNLWGRKVKLVRMKGSGSDETSARADAVKVATEIKAFASLGGPGQESAYAEELASRHVVCVACGLSLPDSAFQKNAPYMWGNLQTPEQFLLNVGDYVTKRLLDKPAEFAGDEALRKKKRVFGVVHFEQDPPVFSGVEEEMAKKGAKVGYKNAITLTYQLVISELAEKARVLIARLKEKHVTTVIFLGDPIMPIYLTKAATSQGFFPEWMMTGTVLTDTTVFGRLYDQKQWAHAFGLSSLAARTPPQQGEGWRLHKWYTGKDPEAVKTVGVIMEPLRVLMLGIHMAGPNLTPETFRDGLFAYPPSGGTPTAPQLSFGKHGFFPNPDFNAVDDMQEVWWNAKAHGPDEQTKEGDGMMEFADGGKRYLPGAMPTGPPHAFVEEGAVDLYPSIPKDERPPDYPPPPGSPAADHH